MIICIKFSSIADFSEVLIAGVLTTSKRKWRRLCTVVLCDSWYISLHAIQSHFVKWARQATTWVNLNTFLLDAVCWTVDVCRLLVEQASHRCSPNDDRSVFHVRRLLATDYWLRVVSWRHKHRHSHNHCTLSAAPSFEAYLFTSFFHDGISSRRCYRTYMLCLSSLPLLAPVLQVLATSHTHILANVWEKREKAPFFLCSNFRFPLPTFPIWLRLLFVSVFIPSKSVLISSDTLVSFTTKKGGRFDFSFSCVFLDCVKILTYSNDSNVPKVKYLVEYNRKKLKISILENVAVASKWWT